MFRHHLKIAFRNLRKYKTQNIISVIGLAVGFACFAFSALWIRYEMNYDNFHSKADRIYRVHAAPYKWDEVGTETNASELTDCPYPLAEFLKSHFPEIEDAGTMVVSATRSLESYELTPLFVDYATSNMFDLNLPEDFFLPGRTDRPIAVLPELNTEEVKKLANEQFRMDIQRTIPRWPINTNFTFNMVSPITYYSSEQMLTNWHLQYETPIMIRFFEIYVLVHDNVDIRSLKRKLDKIDIPELVSPMSLVLTPLKQLRYDDPSGTIHSDIKFTHIRIFAIAGLMVIVCSLFNHLTLYVTRIRMRLRELALRKVNGASDRQIAATLYYDFLLVVLLSLVVGFILMVWLLPTFKEYASIGVDNVNIYTELTLYAVLLILCSFITAGIPILYFRKQALNESIQGSGSPGSRNMFRKGSLLVQLIVGLGMIFCSLVFIKQIRFLQQTDLGIQRHNIVQIRTNFFSLSRPYAEQIKQVPGVVDAIAINRNTLSPTHGSTWPHPYVDSLGNAAVFNPFMLTADNHFFEFFGVKIIQGTNYPNDNTVYQFLFNETAMKLIGEFEVAKNYSGNNGLVGVMQDFYLSPTEKVRATKIHFPTPTNVSVNDGGLIDIAYKYEEGMREQTEEAVRKWLNDEFSGMLSRMGNVQLPSSFQFEVIFTYIEDVFDENFKSERALLSLLSVMTLTCILIAVFGVYSLSNLTCQQRRKEIAIRKINGAEVLDIMNIFFKEYLVLLLIAALVAFPAGFIIMKSWLEGYVKQTSMDAWLYVLIFLLVFVVIVLSIVSMVWKAANRNPAEVVKAE